MDCHMLFPAMDEPPERLQQHTDIVLDHGINDRCRNCHDTVNRDRLVLQSGESIPFSEVVELCAKCHGPTYRDWQRGMHGRTNGFWNVVMGDAWRLNCIECHDPHNPRFPAMDPLIPLPPPNTLRMGRRRGHSSDIPEEADPLRRVLHRSKAAATGQSDVQPEEDDN
jgi:hypothetical protein